MSENVTHVTGIAGLQAEEGRREALDNIAETVKERRTGTDDTAPLGGQPPASNSAKDASGGIPSGNGGLSSTAGISGPEDSLVGGSAPVSGGSESSAQDGIIASVTVLADKFKTALGLGGATSGTETSETEASGGVNSPTTAESGNTVGSQAYAYAAGAGTAIAGAAVAARDYIVPASSTTAAADTSARATSSPAAASHDLADNNLQSNSSPSSTTVDPTTDSISNTNTANTTDDSTSTSANMSEPTNEKPVEPTTSGDGPAPGEPKEPIPSGNDAENPDKVEGKSKDVSDKAAAVRENPDAIPTAGGKRLGEDHMGESKKIPELPPKTEEEKSKEVQDNTAKNTGGATGGPGHEDAKHDGEKHGFMDKVKDAIHHKK